MCCPMAGGCGHGPCEGGGCALSRLGARLCVSYGQAFTCPCHITFAECSTPCVLQLDHTHLLYNSDMPMLVQMSVIMMNLFSGPPIFRSAIISAGEARALQLPTTYNDVKSPT